MLACSLKEQKTSSCCCGVANEWNVDGGAPKDGTSIYSESHKICAYIYKLINKNVIDVIVFSFSPPEIIVFYSY